MTQDINIQSEEEWAKVAYENARAKLASLVDEDSLDDEQEDEGLVEETE